MIIFLILACICNSIMDTLAHHYEKSIFNNFNPKWWNPNISWYNHKNNNKYIEFMLSTVLIYITDAWHFFKILTILFSLLFAMTDPNLSLCWYLIIWGIIFEVFYNYIWVIKWLKST